MRRSAETRYVLFVRSRSRARLLVLSLVASAGMAVGAVGGAWAAGPAQGAGAAGLGSAPSSGGAGLSVGGLAPTPSRPPVTIPAPPSLGSRGHWLNQFTVTEYWPAPEAWFVGRLVTAPGLPGKHRVDWLYSALGVSMEGDGFGLDGRRYHIDSLGSGGWVTAAGSSTSPGDGWQAGSPFWRAGGYWRNRSGGVTFPLQSGGWYAGAGRSYVPLRGVTFAAGPSLPLRFLQSIAVDPQVIPLGSRVYIPAYRHDGFGGWFVAQDTGGAIGGHHVDVYRQPPASRSDSGQYLTHQRVYVIRPGSS